MSKINVKITGNDIKFFDEKGTNIFSAKLDVFNSYYGQPALKPGNHVVGIHEIETNQQKVSDYVAGEGEISFSIN